MQWLIKRLALASLLCTTGASLSACSSEPEETGVDESQIRDEFAQTAWKTVEYTVRGEVAALPSGVRPSRWPARPSASSRGG